MKHSKLTIVAMLFACSLFAFSPANAAIKTPTNVVTSTTTSLFGGISSLLGGILGTTTTTPTTGGTKTGTTTSLPIDNNIWFLVIAAGLVGTKVIVSKSKQAELQAVKVK